MGAASASLPLDFPLFAASWLMTGLASLYGRSQLASVMPSLANVVVSNVPGPQAAVYFAGARMRSYFPVSIPAHGMALNITVHSYDGDLDYGLIACRRVVPDLSDLGEFMVAEHRALAQCAQRLRAPGDSEETRLATPPAVTAPARPRTRGGATAQGAAARR